MYIEYISDTMILFLKIPMIQKRNSEFTIYISSTDNDSHKCAKGNERHHGNKTQDFSQSV